MTTYEDRLQSVGKYFPYGEDRYNPTPANPSNDQEKFATYTRDSISGLDYAVNRYYGAGTGRFMSPDPYRGSASPRSPQTWNRYPYTPGDPVNYNDAKGLAATCESTGLFCGCDPDDPWGCDPCDPGGEHIFGLHFVSSFGGNDCGDPPPAPAPPPVPTCSGLLADGIEVYLDAYRNPLTGQPSPLAGEGNLFTIAGAAYDIDPRLLVAIAQLESYLGTSSVAQNFNNAFGILRRVGRRYLPAAFDTLSDSTIAAFGIANVHIEEGQDTVALLYSGVANSYCVNTPGYPCANAINAITSDMNLIPNLDPSTLRPINPNALSYPCPPGT